MKTLRYLLEKEFKQIKRDRFLLHKGQGREQDQDHGGVWRAAGAVKL